VSRIDTDTVNIGTISINLGLPTQLQLQPLTPSNPGRTLCSWISPPFGYPRE
jgi:hypothetical protein